MKYKSVLQAVTVGVLVIASPLVTAKQLWSDFSVSYLKGDDYLNPFADYEYGRDVVTMEYASGHSWGSTFMFLDRLSSDDGSSEETYGEFGASYTLAKFEDSFFKNVYATGQIEHQSQTVGFNNYLVGAGVNLDVPGFSFVNVTYYRRFNDDPFNTGKGDNNQLTVVWRYDNGNFRFDGFWDIVDSTDNDFFKSESGFNFTPQIKYNIGPMIGMESGRLDVGMEYIYWKNKFGVDGADEKNANLIVKWHF